MARTLADQIMERSYKEEEIMNINSPVSRVIELFKN
jgi:hypothetical protein